MKKTLAVLCTSVLMAGVAYANFCAKDYVPAATLLVPYVVVDADPVTGDPDPGGYNTLLVVTNASRTRQIIHLTIWNAVSSPVVDFSEILSGYDVWSISFRDLLNGQWANFDTYTSSAGFFSGQAVGPDVNPYGPTRNRTNSNQMDWPELSPGSEDVGTSDWAAPDTGAPLNRTCPPHANKQGIEGYTAFMRDKIKAPLHVWAQYAATSLGCLSGITVSDTGSWLRSLGSYPYFFYVTVDVVSACTDFFPSQEDYWEGGLPLARNVLYGDVFYLNSAQNFSESLPAVSIEADADWNAQNFPNKVGFYDYLVDTQTALGPIDFHEPLPNSYAFNYLITGGLSTEVIVWKGKGYSANAGGDNFAALYADVNGTNGTVDACRGYIYFAWDEDEHFKSYTGAGGGISPPPDVPGEPNIFPFETQKVPVTLANFNGLLNANGWMLLVFDPANGVGNSATQYAYEYSQAYVAAKYNYGTYSTALEAATLGNSNCFANQVLPYFNTYNGISGDGLVAQPNP